MASKVNDFNRPQPRSEEEMHNVAAEAMGFGAGRKKAPRFHRMSISAAENGFSIDHTMEHEPEDNDRNRESGDPFHQERHTTKTVVFGHDHPMSAHIHALHDHMKQFHGEGTQSTGQGYQTTPVHPKGPQNR